MLEADFRGAISPSSLFLEVAACRVPVEAVFDEVLGPLTVVVGNLTADPRMGEADGTKVANFRMAVNRWRKPGQEPDESVQERTEFIDVECWGTQAANVEATLERGDRAIVAGQLRYDQWTDEAGNLKSRLKIKAFAVGPSLEFQSLSSH